MQPHRKETISLQASCTRYILNVSLMDEEAGLTKPRTSSRWEACEWPGCVSNRQRSLSCSFCPTSLCFALSFRRHYKLKHITPTYWAILTLCICVWHLTFLPSRVSDTKATSSFKQLNERSFKAVDGGKGKLHVGNLEIYTHTLLKGRTCHPKICLFSLRITLNCFLRNSRPKENLWKPHRSYPSERGMYVHL